MQLTSRAFYADSLDSSLNGRDQTRIAIAGGGLSGICVALHIQRYARSETIIDIYESTGEVGNGPAYAWRNPAFLLNGEAAHLSMFDEQPLEFVQWLASTPHAQPFLTPDRPLANQFVPRYLFSDYIRHCLGKAHSKPSACVLRVHRNTTVLNIEPSGLRATLVLSDGERCPADRVIVATGNEPPCPSSYICREALCIENPWIPDWVDFVAPGPVLMVGTGQTMVDAAIALWAAGHDGVIHSVSRRGVLPKTHVYNVPSWNIETAAFPGKLADIVRFVRAESRAAMSDGSDWRSVTNAVRPLTHEAWRKMPLCEKRRFLRHLSPFWWAYRQRLAPQVGKKVEEKLAAGQLVAYAGRIVELKRSDCGANIVIRSRSGEHITVQAKTIVNCTGPNFDCASSSNPLLGNLMTGGMARPHVTRVGIDVTSDYALIGSNGRVSGIIYALGSPVRGEFLETLAIRDVRRQSRQLANVLVRT